MKSMPLPQILDMHLHTFSLLLRYNILYSQESLVRLEKVSFEQGKIVAGLKASKDIPPVTPILATCASMSVDSITEGRAISTIETSSRLKRDTAHRAILGVFRFANHDCDPNSQVFHITP
jgi:hypothetical protein